MGEYYNGYYWGATPYDSFDFEDRTADIELRNRALTRIRTLGKARIRDITILLKDALVTLIGTILTNIQILAEVI
jgi:hypothetical protein